MLVLHVVGKGRQKCLTDDPVPTHTCSENIIIIMDTLLTFEGCNFFRQRLVLSTLSCRPVRISKIREDDEEIGLRGK